MGLRGTGLSRIFVFTLVSVPFRRHLQSLFRAFRLKKRLNCWDTAATARNHDPAAPLQSEEPPEPPEGNKEPNEGTLKP